MRSLNTFFIWGSGILAACTVLYLSALNIALSAQFAIGFLTTVTILLLIRLPVSRRLEIRLIIMLLGLFIALRYMIWRTTSTIVFTSVADIVPMLLLFLAEVYSFFIFSNGLFINVLPLERPEIQPPDYEKLPRVDILIPTFNEPLDLVSITAISCKLIDYPREKLRIFILDDGATHARINSDDSEIRKQSLSRKYLFKNFAEKNGFTYLTRKDNTHAKAGNINAALPNCQGELLLILDCDHVPTRDILKRMVAFFCEDPKLFLVQSPHFMINANPVEKNLALFADAPSESEMFYGVIQKGLDFWNSSFFCGSAAVLKTKYLKQIGGISGITITEDAETSLELHAMGLKSLYFADPLTSGLAPEKFKDFVNQRIRWAQGMIQIAILKKPLFKPGLKFYQKIGYSNSSLFWLFGLARTIFLLSPLFYLFFGLHIYMASVPQVMVYAVPYLISSFYIADFLFGRYRWPLFSELYETAQSIFLLPAILGVFLNPRKPAFHVTPKGQSVETDYLSPLAYPFITIFFACITALPFAYYRWKTYPLDHDVVLICTAWIIFHIIMLLLCIGSLLEKHQLRKFPRTWADGQAMITYAHSSSAVKADIDDLSLGGMSVNIPANNAPHYGENIYLNVKDGYGNAYNFSAKVIRVKRKRAGTCRIALEFIINTEMEYKQLIGYVYGDSYRWKKYEERKRRPAGIFQGVFYLLGKGLRGAGMTFTVLGKLFMCKLARQAGYTRKAVFSFAVNQQRTKG